MGAVTAPHVVLQSLSLRHVGVAVTIFVPCVVSWSRSLHCVWFCGPEHCATCGFAVPAIVLCVVLQSRTLCHVWFCGPGHCATCGFAVLDIVPHGCCRCCLCATCGFTVVVVVPRVVSRSWSLRHMWCRGCHCCAVWVSRLWPLHHVGVAVAVFAPRVVLWSQSLCCMWCCGCGRRTACGVAGAIVVPRVVSQSLLPHCSYHRTALYKNNRGDLGSCLSGVTSTTEVGEGVVHHTGLSKGLERKCWLDTKDST